MPEPIENIVALQSAQGPLTVPDYQLLRQIGTGSYGEVWLARNVIGTYRAIKFVLRQKFDDPRPFERELEGIRKFEPVSRTHEGLVDILHIGGDETKGFFYYVMELGDDVILGQQIDPATYKPRTLAREATKRVPASDCVQIGLSLSKALEYLHNAGLVHRDIKPSNIIFVSDVPKLADIGLVASFDQSLSCVGTEGFIPREGPGTVLADLFSLGKVLYEISTGRDRRDFPKLPEDFNQFLDKNLFLELNAIILKAAHADPSLRYQSASELHSELAVLDAGKSIIRLHSLERRWQLLRRAALISIVPFMGVLFLYYHFTRERLFRAEREQREVGFHMAEGISQMENGNLIKALPSFVEAFRFDRGFPQRERIHRSRIAEVLKACPKLVQMWFDSGEIRDASFSPNGAQVLVAFKNGKVQVRNSRSGEAISPFFGPEKPLHAAAFSPDGRLVATSGELYSVALWDAVTGE